jgi:hypothetical protein
VTITVLFIMLLVIVLAWFNGTNGISKGVATLVGSGTANTRGAIIWGTLWTVLGGAASMIWVSRRHCHPRGPGVFLGFLFLAILTACVAEKQRALYSPLDPETPYYDNYGYSETAITGDTVEITYLSRDESAIPYLNYVEQTKQALEQQAHDFALWRAAEATLENGFTHFVVEEITARTQKHIVGRDPVTYHRDLNYMILVGYSAYRTNIWLQPVVTLRARLLPEAVADTTETANVHDAQTFITRFESAYPLARESVDPPLIPR